MIDGIVFFFQRFIASVIFDRNSVCQLIVSQQLAVPVVDIAPRAFQLPLFFYL